MRVFWFVRILLACLLALAIFEISLAPVALSDECDHQPGPLPLIGAGLLMAPVAYFLGVSLHEGSHALAATIFGAKVTDFRILPGYYNGSLFLGETAWQGQLSKTQENVVLIAPKITDLAVLGTYTALLETDSLPRNKWALLPINVIGTMALVDFAKHLPSTDPNNDMVRFYDNIGAHTEVERLPYRLIYGALVAGAAVEVGRGWYRLFKYDDARPAKGPRKVNAMALTPYGSPTLSPTGIGWAGEF